MLAGEYSGNGRAKGRKNLIKAAVKTDWCFSWFDIYERVIMRFLILFVVAVLSISFQSCGISGNMTRSSDMIQFQGRTAVLIGDYDLGNLPDVKNDIRELNRILLNALKRNGVNVKITDINSIGVYDRSKLKEICELLNIDLLILPSYNVYDSWREYVIVSTKKEAVNLELLFYDNKTEKIEGRIFCTGEYFRSQRQIFLLGGLTTFAVASQKDDDKEKILTYGLIGSAVIEFINHIVTSSPDYQNTFEFTINRAIDHAFRTVRLKVDY